MNELGLTPRPSLGARSPHADLKAHRQWLQRGGQPSAVQDQDFDETPTDRDVNQTAMEAEIVQDLGPEVRLQHHQDISQLKGRVPTTDELQREFQTLAADKSIPFEYLPDGCYARAHLMCDQLHKDEVNCAKMFVMLEHPWMPGGLHAENKYTRGEWWYHVAPLVFAQDQSTGKVEPFIVDPSMADHPLKPEEWVHDMWDERTPIKIDVTRDPQYGPYESDGAPASFEESLEPARQDMAEYSALLKDIKDAQQHPADCYLIAA